MAHNGDEKIAADFLGVSVRQVRNWRYRGGGPVYSKLGSRVVYDVADLEAFKAARKRTSTSDPGPQPEPAV